MQYDFFISHCREDKAGVAFPLYHQLSYLGFRVWLDRNRIMPGDRIAMPIEVAIANSEGVIAVIAEPYLTRDWTVKELTLTVDLEKSRKTEILLPVFHELSPDEVWRYFPFLKGRAYEEINASRLRFCTPTDHIIIDRIVHWYLSRILKSEASFSWDWLYGYKQRDHIAQLLYLLEVCVLQQAENRTYVIEYLNAIRYTVAVLLQVSPDFMSDLLYTLSCGYCRDIGRFTFQFQSELTDEMLLSCKTLLMALLEKLKAGLYSL